MLLLSLGYALVASIAFASVSAAPSTDNTSSVNDTENNAYCHDVVGLYQNATTSNTYTIPAVVQPLDSLNASTAPLTRSPTQIWQVKSAFGSSDGLTNITSIYLNAQNDGPLPIPPALSTCRFIFNLPAEDDIKTLDNGDCSSLISKACVNDIQSRVRELSQSIASSPSMPLEQACNSLAQSLSALPKSCPKGPSSDKFKLTEWKGHNLTSEANNTKCPSGPPELPILLTGNSEPSEQRNSTSSDDKLIKETTPVLLAFFTNGTLFHGTPFAETQLLCTRPENVTSTTYDNSSSAAGLSSKTDTTVLVGVALATSALLSFAL